MDWKITDGATQIIQYLKLAQDCKFEISQGDVKIDTMNILFDTINNLVCIMASRGSFFEMKLIPMDDSFTKYKQIMPQTDSIETSQSEQSITNEAFKLDIKASQSDGIFF